MYNKMMVASGIPSARRKWVRALEHAEKLNAEVQSFRDQSPYDFEIKSLGNAPNTPDIRLIVKVTKAPPIPESWSLILGDFLTNARAALDHAVFPHVRAHAPSVSEHRIQYPIFDSHSDFESKAKPRFQGDVLRVVEDSQPYLAPDPDGHALRILRDLVNVDKHRTVLLANYSLGDFEVPPSDLYELVSPPKLIPKPMTVGAVVARAHLRLRRPVVGEHWTSIPNNVSWGETIEIPRMGKPGGLLQAVECIRLALGPHIDNLEAAGC